jgi:bifunctional ADP-heptose synthase (sugar kinase/adenylyltransferase)
VERRAVIVGREELSRLHQRVAMVDGGFDPVHAGHVEYFRAARDLGLPLLCNVSPDGWVERKHPVLLPQKDRVLLIDAIRFVDYAHASSVSTEEVLELLRPRFYVKGLDWKGRLPARQVELCAEHGVEIVFLDTVLDSSSRLVADYARRLGEWAPPS